MGRNKKTEMEKKTQVWVSVETHKVVSVGLKKAQKVAYNAITKENDKIEKKKAAELQ